MKPITIQDCEDSVAAADGEDKAQVYENWLGLMKGFSRNFSENDQTMTRVLNQDRDYLKPEGDSFLLVEVHYWLEM